MPNQPKNQRQESANTSDEVLIRQHELELLCEQIESWKALVESQEAELRNYKQQLEEAEKELKITNRDLCEALLAQKYSLTEAVSLAITVVSSGKSTRECVAEILVAIYNSPVPLAALQTKCELVEKMQLDIAATQGTKKLQQKSSR